MTLGPNLEKKTSLSPRTLPRYARYYFNRELDLRLSFFFWGPDVGREKVTIWGHRPDDVIGARDKDGANVTLWDFLKGRCRSGQGCAAR